LETCLAYNFVLPIDILFIYSLDIYGFTQS
jgi:hypothetical protein